MADACPNLRNLALVSCRGLYLVSIDLQQMEECRLAFDGNGDYSVNISSPKLHSLEVQGCGRVSQVKENHFLKTQSISNSASKINF